MANLDNNNDNKKLQPEIKEGNTPPQPKKKNRWLKFFKIAILSFLGLFVVLAIVLSLSSTRNWTAHKVVNILNEKFKTQIKFSSIDVNLFGNISIHDLTIEDYKGLEFIKAKEVYADSDWFSLIANTNHINIHSLTAKDLDMKVITYKGDSVANFNRFINLFDNGKKKAPNKPEFQLDSRISIQNSKLSIVNQNSEGDAGKWLDATHLNILIPNLKVKGSDVSAQVNQFSFITERWGKKHIVDNFSTHFTFNKEYLFLDNLLFNTDHSLLQGHLKLNLNNGKFEDFGNKVVWDMILANGSQLSGYDLSYFVNDWDNYKPINISGKMDGVLNEFYLENFKFGRENTQLATQKIKIADILNKSFNIETNSLSTNFTYEGLKGLLPSFISKKMGNTVDPFGRIKFNGALKANPKAIFTRGQIVSGVGQAKVHRLTLLDYSTNNQKFQGLVDLKNFNVAAITKNNQVGLVTGTIDVKGENFDINRMRLKTKSNISSIELTGKTIQNLIVDGTMVQKTFDGIVNVKDPNAKANIKGIVDFSSPRLKADVLAQVEHLNVAHFTGKKEQQTVSGIFDVQLAMKDLNDMSLDTKVSQVHLATLQQNLNIPQADIRAYFDDGKRIVSVQAPNAIDGKISGKFNLEDIGGMVQNSIDRIIAGAKSKRYYRGQYFDLDFNISQGFINFFQPNLKIKDQLHISGNYNGNTNDLVLNADASYLKYIMTKKDAEAANEALAKSDIDYQFEPPAKAKDSAMVNNLSLKINTAQVNDQLSITADKVVYGNHIVQDLNFKGSNENGEVLHLSTTFKHGSKDDEDNNALKEYAINLNQTTDANGDYVIRFEPTEIKLNHVAWRVDTSPELNHSITYKKRTGAIDIHNLKVYSDESAILVNGIFKNGKNFDFDTEITNLDITKLMALSKSESDINISGVINGTANIKMNQNSLEPLVDLKMDSLKMNGNAMGNIVINADKTDRPNIFSVDARVVSSELLGADKLKLTGTINNNTKSPSLDLVAELNEFDLSFAQEFVKSVFSNFRGKASGQLNIGGTVNDIDYQGNIALKDFGLKLNFSGVDYNFDDTVIPLTKGYAVLNNIGIKDGRDNSKGSISGAIQFADAASMGLNLIMRADNLLLLNTTQKDFDTFWGRVYGSGDIFVDGPVTALNLDAKMKVLDNSTFTLNSNSTSSVDEYKMLRFVERDKEGQIIATKKKKTGANMDINFDISIDKGSTVSVLVGDDVGDISVRGLANNLKFKLRRSGQMSMNGTYMVDNGTFISKAILERTFQIANGSSISWDGNVMNPSLDIKANYFRTVTNAGEYLNIGKLPPINVMLTTEITQTLQKPNIEFDVSAPEVSTQIKEALAFKMSKPDEKVLQFGSILALNNFNVANSAGTDFDIGGSLASQGYNILFKQLGSVLNTISNQFQVDLNYIKGDNASNTGDRANAGVSIALSPRISIKTGLGVPISKTQYTDANFLSGEGILEYDWSKKNNGSRLLRVYSKPSNISNVSGQAGANQTWGAGVVYSKSFNRFFGKKKTDTTKQKKDTVKVK
ncbi:translocation/assembly module TamB domain-containing protein [Riemerella columbina]|uniref:translocation/assembly module TamB domain-containing protein n=1 Tax=Riemerella columbina TaxID=103810 RepID=UPI00039E1019|nr:translocation/assembly module TamB [Riemerella columbina]